MTVKYPAWFSASYEPMYKPTPPLETVWEYEDIHSVSINDHEYFDLPQFPAGTNCFKIQVTRDCYDNSVYDTFLVFSHKKKIPNPNYVKQRKAYEEQLKQYNIRLEEWKHYKKIWDEEQEVKNREQRLETYKKLKEEFEHSNNNL